MRIRHVEVAASVAGSVLVLAALAVIWVARLTLDHDVYVSELGATGAPTARDFEAALILVAAGGSLIAFAGRGIRSRLRILALWTPSISLWFASGSFLVASQVSCTPGCPLPYGPTFDWQDVTHIVFAVLAFAAACWAMLQTSFAHDHRMLARFSRVCGLAVAVIAGTGGILSVARFQTDFGARCELAATSIAIAWVAVYGTVTAVRARRGQRSDMSSSSRLASPTST